MEGTHIAKCGIAIKGPEAKVDRPKLPWFRKGIHALSSGNMEL